MFLENLKAVINVKSKTECTRLIITWDAPALDSNCQSLLHYSLHYKIYSNSGNQNWLYACNNTIRTQCQIDIDSEKIAPTVIYSVSASTRDNRFQSPNQYYRTWPSLNCKLFSK